VHAFDMICMFFHIQQLDILININISSGIFFFSFSLFVSIADLKQLFIDKFYLPS